jgi:hypothetical protein
LRLIKISVSNRAALNSSPAANIFTNNYSQLGSG